MAHRQLPRYREGQEFHGTAFGKPVTVRLIRREWIRDSDGPFWSWTCQMLPPHSGEATICEDVLGEEYWKVVRYAVKGGK